MPQQHKVCEVCKENAATVHLTEMANQHVVQEKHLCDVGAAKQGLIGKFQMSAVAELLGNLKDKAKGGGKDADLKCPDCGLTYGEFRGKARFGCSRDYDVFRKHVVALLEKIHGATEHAGKKPKGGAPALPPAPVAETPAKPAKTAKSTAHVPAAKAIGAGQIAELEKRLEGLLKAEKYEEAAKLRDEIRDLKAKKEPS